MLENPSGWLMVIIVFIDVGAIIGVHTCTRFLYEAFRYP
jgi:pheromone shutdown protein TraB